MKIKLKKQLFIPCVIAVMILILLLLSNLTSKSNVNMISVKNDMTVICLDGDMFYDISTYGVDNGIYSESDYFRLMNIDVDSDDFSDSLSVYYTDKLISKAFLKERIVVRNFCNHNVVFITSTNDTRLLVKKGISLPEIKKDNIDKIVITSISHDNISFETDQEISEFIDNYDSYFQKYSNELDGFECRLYYKNSDKTVYEIVNSEEVIQG